MRLTPVCHNSIFNLENWLDDSEEMCSGRPLAKIVEYQNLGISVDDYRSMHPNVQEVLLTANNIFHFVKLDTLSCFLYVWQGILSGM